MSTYFRILEDGGTWVWMLSATKKERKHNHNDLKHLLSIDLQSSEFLLLLLLMMLVFFFFLFVFRAHTLSSNHLFLVVQCYLRNCNFWWQETINGECLPRTHKHTLVRASHPRNCGSHRKNQSKLIYEKQTLIIKRRVKCEERKNERKKVLNQTNSRTI